MVASLQHKKEALEAKIRDKTSELRKLCIEEAELTGILPAETPLEPGESPPQFRRRIGTSFTYPENLINKLKSKEDEALAALELECKIQTGIAEAALGLANDGSASKSVRRKHRVLYEESQRRLSELESRLNSVRQNQPKQKKKPRPQTEIESDCVDGDVETLSDNVRFSILMSLPENGQEKSINSIKTPVNANGFKKIDPALHHYHQRMVQNTMLLPNVEYRHSVMIPEFPHHIRSSNPSPNDLSDGWYGKGRDLVYNSPLRHSPLIGNVQDFYADSFIGHERFGSLERNPQPLEVMDHESRLSSTLPRNVYISQANSVSVLLPGQTYPENSLMRTQSLGSVDSAKQHADRKTKEKEWYESSLDSSPPKLLPKMDSPMSHTSEDKDFPFHYENNNNNSRMNQASINSIQFDTVVPYESPKNHTVVQAGKWQPYREITKPFEMSDFYKYSTKFRKSQSQVLGNEAPSILQQKGIYKPLRPLECHPLASNGDTVSLKIFPNSNTSQNDNCPSDLVSWYQEKSYNSKPRSSTLV
ncbi:uncharacterized protein sstn [Halyomorpha halys]|uniref:uncharacterized protein sstn n=1 Tax=Halyomorpha halys TaxID=286706 RepID=UPI0006D4E0CF|nr:uncharacterized protein LOC112211399 [Halyomorpha halys]